jgi:hypothetical protein
MPVTSAGIIGVLVPNLVATSLIGTGVPTYANAVAQGLVTWIPQVTVQTQDVGTGGSGKNVPLPLLVPQPLLIVNITSGMSSQELLGVMAPLLILGLSNGLALAFLQMLVNTTHVGVGTGAGVATFRAPPATPSMIRGFKSAGMKGPATERKAAALGQALDQTFASLLLPVVIVGSVTPSAATGRGSGKII